MITATATTTAAAAVTTTMIRYDRCTGKLAGKLPVLSSTWTKRKLKMF